MEIQTEANMKIATQEILDFLKIAYDGAVVFDKKLDHGVDNFETIIELLVVVINSHPEPAVKTFALGFLGRLQGPRKDGFP